MIRLLSATLVGLSAVSIGCTPKSPPANLMAPPAKQATSEIDSELLCRHWFHSPEEQISATDQIYRVEGYKFPPSRFRMQYIFQKNGECEWYYLSPDDDHRFKPGHWKSDPRDQNTIQIVKGETTEVYKVTELSKEVLRMTQIEPAGDSE